ncbi:hypothetical protein [Schinkia azotoformans]|uniref:hypothetical protein n=1 Tax=Schinkia azotoformans TaxID=1454 RepID=UPI002DB61814|nr:hypothetical protein [Schinkia azotoformans]MEC1715930.1 hypothetical protein [Schinkia azotoformans]MEC1741569.1 hypothetical protein [Schinkia azotoformans]MEC1744563.1 hypothetical protein [Schinkia azotoformans]MEC1756271.1 hypothetical protein [Schinkia azotoformans]MEC1765248.1 hypothetical protein [Schinkia azotoformans]
MNIDQALKQVAWQKAEYFKWKHDIKYDQTRNKKTEEQFMKLVNKRTMNSFLAWERTQEYANLVHLLMQSKVHNDLLQSYQQVSDKAVQGDEKSIKLLLDMSKVIKDYAKVASKEFEKNSEEIEEDDDLEI